MPAISFSPFWKPSDYVNCRAQNPAPCAVPAAAIADRRQRKYVLDHHARGHGVSVDLVRQIEQRYASP